MSKIRKAIAAFITPLITLPLTAWISGAAEVDWQLAITTLVTAALAAYAVWQIPNATDTT